LRKELIEIVCCPDDKAGLVLASKQEDEHGDVITGTLTCKKCHFVYPIEDGIPNLLPPSYHIGNVGRDRGSPPTKAGAKTASAPAKKAAKTPAKNAAKTSAKAPAKRATEKSTKP
jgi:uncharacterized protein YbaR (Trm112 family)